MALNNDVISVNCFLSPLLVYLCAANVSICYPLGVVGVENKHFITVFM